LLSAAWDVKLIVHKVARRRSEAVRLFFAHLWRFTDLTLQIEFALTARAIMNQPSPMTDINQQLIADKLNISRATVSRCFTNHPGISPKTRAQVFSLAAKLGYTHLEKRVDERPKRNERSLAFGVLVCVELPSFEHTAYANPGQELLNGLSDFARGQDVRLDLNFVRPQDLHLTAPSYARITGTRRRIWQGVILIYPFPRTIVEELAGKYPVVSLVEQYSGAPLNCVDVDHHRGIGKLIDRLRGLGHERIGFFTYRYPVEASWSLRRFGAYVEHLTAQGLPVRLEDTISVGPRNAEPWGAARDHALERTRHGVTAWICANDHQAYELIAHFQKHGLRVPQDVSVTGFDGIARPAAAPDLSTVQIPYHQIGVTGGKRLLDLIDKRFGAHQHILLDCDLHEGATIGPVHRP
jgi:LacI family transcriptional regulator